jgi:hypothetical protein
MSGEPGLRGAAELSPARARALRGRALLIYLAYSEVGQQSSRRRSAVASARHVNLNAVTDPPAKRP